MEHRLGRIEDRLEKHSDILTDIQGNLQEHMRRTQIAENNIEAIAKSIAPIQEHVALMNGLGKIILGLSAIVGAVAAVWLLFK